MLKGKDYEIILLRQLPFGLVPGVYALIIALGAASIDIGGYWIHAQVLVSLGCFYAYHSTYKWLAGRLNMFTISDLLNEYKKDGTFLDNDCLIKKEEDKREDQE